MTASENQKVAVITGGSRGIGKAVAEALVAQGIRVVIGDILDDDGHQTAQELNRQCAGDSQMVAYIHTDVTLYKDVIALFRFAEATFGGVDVRSSIKVDGEYKHMYLNRAITISPKRLLF